MTFSPRSISSHFPLSKFVTVLCNNGSDFSAWLDTPLTVTRCLVMTCNVGLPVDTSVWVSCSTTSDVVEEEESTDLSHKPKELETSHCRKHQLCQPHREEQQPLHSATKGGNQQCLFPKVWQFCRCASFGTTNFLEFGIHINKQQWGYLSLWKCSVGGCAWGLECWWLLVVGGKCQVLCVAKQQMNSTKKTQWLAGMTTWEGFFSSHRSLCNRKA